MHFRKYSTMTRLRRGWIVIVTFALISSLMLVLCAGSDTPTCFNFNVFSFWINTHDPRLVCVNESCSEAPYQLKSAPRAHNANAHHPSSETIHLTVVACGDRLDETLVMIKSAVVISEAVIHVHIFADDDLRPEFKQQIKRWPVAVRKNLVTSIYPITYPEGTDLKVWINLFKLCATQRLFIPYVIPANVTDSVLYVDTDILFMRPLEHIWNFFKRFNSRHISALAPEHEIDRQGWYNRFARHPYYGERGVNSGVMLMKLARMREANWVDHMIAYHKEYRLKITWGDQDLINIYFHYHPDQLYVFPCHWNFRPDHCMYQLNCQQAKKCGVSVIHGNRGVYHNDNQPAFKAIYNVFKYHKFESDIETGLLEPLKIAIKAQERSGYCGQIGNVFVQQLERQLKLRSQGCKDNASCDPFESEDFELEAKLEDTAKAQAANAQAAKAQAAKAQAAKAQAAKAEAAKAQTAKAQAAKAEAEKAEAGRAEAEKKRKPAKEYQDESPTKNNEVNKGAQTDQSVFDEITSGLMKQFPAITEVKLLPILIEHFTRLEDARERHTQAITHPQENIDSALLSPVLHEDMLGFVQTIKAIKNADDYLRFLSAVIDTLKLKKTTDAIATKDPIHLVVVACGDRLEEPIVMMKSAILLARNFLNFHVIAEEHLQPQFKFALESWPQNLQNKFKLHIHDIQYPVKRAADWKNLFKKCATQRLFLPKIMPNLDSVIYVDTDILFLRPIDDLWDRFNEFNSTHIAGLAPEHEDAHVSWYKRFARHPYYPPLGVNSGVMPMNLTRMREARWLEYIVPYFHTYGKNTTWGDQDLINIFFHFFPEKLFVFECDWNYRQDHCMYMHVCKRAEEHGVSILHGARGVYQNDKEKTFRGVYKAIRDHQFGASMKDTLLPKMRENVKKAADSYCGKVGYVLSKQFEQHLN